MSANPPIDTHQPNRHVGELVLAALICTLALFPPETRGESMAGGALLIVLLVLVTSRAAIPWTRLVPLSIAGLAAVPLIRVSAAPGSAVLPVATLVLALAAGIHASAWPRHRGERRVPIALALAAVAVASHGLYQRFHGLDALAQRIEAGMPVAAREVVLERLRLGRAFAGFPTPAALGGFLVIGLPVTAALAIDASRGWRRLWAAAVLIQLAGLLATESGSAGVALVGALLLAALRRPLWRRPLAVAASLAGVLLVGVLLLRGSEITDLQAPGSPWRLRAGNFRIASAMIADHPFLGVGPGGYGELYPAYRRAGENESQHVHDLPLELCAEWGLPLGLLLCAGFFVVFAAPILSRRRAGDATWGGVAIGLAAFALQNLLDFTAFLPSSLWIAAVLAGRLHRAPGASVRQPDRRAGAALAAAAACTVLAAAGTAVAGGLAWNDRHFAAEAALAGDGGRALQLAERATRRAPWEVDGWLELVRLSRESAEPLPQELRLAAAERAVALSPVRPSARLARARLRLESGDAPGAYADAARAAELYPGSGDYARTRDELAARFVSRGDWRQGRP